MKQFFKPGDFTSDNEEAWLEITAKEAADIANAKLEREGKVVHGSGAGGWTTMPNPLFLSKGGDPEALYKPTQKALLINIGPIKQKLDLDKNKDEIMDKANKLREVFGNTSEFGNAYQIMVEQVCTKKPCTHPKDKVRPVFNIGVAEEIECFICDCGAKVQIKEFEAAK
jgi:hypothetical protein